MNPSTSGRLSDAALQHRFLLPSAPQETGAFVELLRQAAPGLHARAVTRAITRTYLDSFDWRVWRAGGVLEHLRGPEVRLLRWRHAGGGDRFAPQHVDAPPRVAADVPGRFVRARLLRVLGPRVLLPVARSEGHTTEVVLVDGRGKARLRACLRMERLAGAAGEPPLALIELSAVTGYPRALEAVLDAMLDRGVASTLAGDPLEHATALLGRAPLDYPVSPSLPLQPGEPAGAAVRHLQLGLLETMHSNLPGLKAELDSEFLHDYRVALRRARTLHARVHGIFATRVRERFRRELAWLAAMTGPLRDHDVQLAELPDVLAPLAAQQRDALAPFEQWLRARRGREMQALLRALEGRRHARLMTAWERALHQPVPPRTRLANARRPVAAVAAEAIARADRRVLRDGAVVGRHSPPAHLHELRKSCKKLRYLVELFRTLCDAGEVDALVRALKKLQDMLGEYQDLHVRGALLSEFAHVAPAASRAALVCLHARLGARERAVREDFAACFAGFAAPSVRARVRRLVPAAGGAR